MNVTNVTVTKVAEEKTSNGLYIMEYSVVNGDLIRVQATIHERESEAMELQTVIGSITLEYGVVSCNLPGKCNLAPYFTDFDIFLRAIRESILTEE